MAIEVNREELMQEMASAAQRFEALLRAIPPDAIEKPVEGLAWNVGEVAAHVLTVMRRALADRRRSNTPQALADLNALVLAEFEQRDPQQIADLFAADMAVIFQKALPRIPDDLKFPFHAGTQITILTGMAVMLGELIFHGRDIARAINYEWSIHPHTAALAFCGMANMIYGWLKPEARELHEAYVIHFEGESAPVVIWFKDGTVEANRDIPAAPDYEVHVEPVAFVLTFPYQRQPHANEIVNRLAGFFESP